MKSILVLGALAAVGTAQGAAQTAQFTNTSFTGPFVVGQKIPLMWTTGSGLPISLSITNSTWSHKIFDGRTVLPTTYEWVITAFPGFVSGTYQLSLEQLNGGVNKSPAFQAVVVDVTKLSTTTAPVAGSTTTVTWVYWDHACACTKTGTATGPLNTVWPTTTTTWWDDQCGCRKSAAVPVSTLPAANNYTIPAAPPVATAANPTASPNAPSTTASATQSTFTGGTASFGSSMSGILVALAAIALF